jgi:hypothetical protein
MKLADFWTETYRTLHPGDAGLTRCIDDLKVGPIELLEERIDYIFLIHPSGKIISIEHVFDHPFG